MKTFKFMIGIFLSGLLISQADAVADEHDHQVAFERAYAAFEQAQQQQLANHQLAELA